MKIIDAMRRIKSNDEKIADLQRKIADNSADTNLQPSEYADKDNKDAVKQKVTSWLQSCTDLTQENLNLHLAIQRTNISTSVTITIDGKDVTKTIAEWVLRRRLYAQVDEKTWSRLTTKGLTPQPYPIKEGDKVELKISEVSINYDVNLRDKKISEFKSEPHLINAALEIVNATTDLNLIEKVA